MLWLRANIALVVVVGVLIAAATWVDIRVERTEKRLREDIALVRADIRSVSSRLDQQMLSKAHGRSVAPATMVQGSPE